MARQNIAWGVTLTRDSKNDEGSMERLGKEILSTFVVQLMERLDSNSFALPASSVITLKMPHKTPISVDRNVGKIETMIPTQMRMMASLAYKQQVKVP
jgi:hypothetical protein